MTHAFSPAKAMMSPASIDSIAVPCCACILRILRIRSRSPVRALRTAMPDSSRPE